MKGFKKFVVKYLNRGEISFHLGWICLFTSAIVSRNSQAPIPIIIVVTIIFLSINSWINSVIKSWEREINK